MKRKYLILMATLLTIALFSSVTIASFPPWSSLPRLDKQLFQVIKGADAEVNALTVTQIVDMIPGPGTTPRINKVLAWGGNMSWAPSAAYAFGALQCRPVWPPEAAGGPEGVTVGATTSPMCFSEFRVALNYIYGMAQKNASIFAYVLGPQTYGIKSIIPPAQAAWYDNSATLPATTDYAGAWALMQADGFWVDTDAKILYDVNNVACRDLKCYYSASATAWQMELPSFVAAFNDFMDNYLGVTNCNMALVTKDFNTLVYGDLMLYHDFDLAYLGLTGLGPDPDWTISMFSSDYDVPYGWNFAGVHDPYIDHIMDIILHEVDPVKIKAAVFDFQHYFNGEMTPGAIAFGATGIGFCPHHLWSSGMAITSFNPHIENYIDMPCWGSEQCAEQWMFTDWDVGYVPPVAGAIRRCLGDEPTSIEPLYENTLYGWLLMDGVEEGLLSRNPQTLEIQPWLAKDYAFEGPINATTPEGKNIVNGMKITYYIREGIYWQDSGAYKDLNGNGVHDVGEPQYTFPFTAYDVKFAADLFMRFQPGRYDTVWTDMREADTEGPYKVIIWYNASSYWYSTYPSGLAAYPQHIYQKAIECVDNGTYTKMQDFLPTQIKYKDWTGLNPPDAWGPYDPNSPIGGWSALVGTGPFLFGYYNKPTMLGSTIANPNYWAGESPILQSLETNPEHYGLNRFKKELVGGVITLDASYHIEGYKDINANGVLNVGDEVTLSIDVTGSFMFEGAGEFKVVAMAGPTVTQVQLIDYVAELSSTSVVVDFRSMVWNRGGSITWNNNIDVQYIVKCDGTQVAIGTSLNVGSFEKRYITVPINGWNTAPMTIGKHTFTVEFYVKVHGSVQSYDYVCTVERVLAYLPGDADGNGVVNMLDIYTNGIKNFLVDNTMYGWTFMHDATATKPGAILPGKYADVNCDGIINMVDIYRMILMFMKTFP